MDTLQMEIELMSGLNFIQKVIIPNVKYGICYNNKELHECDLLVLSKSKYATEIEIKISKSDFKADFKKKHKHDHILIKNFYYAVPEELEEFAVDMIENNNPDAGLYVVKKSNWNGGYFLSEVKKPSKQNCIKWPDELYYKLLRLGSLRIYNLKKNINILKKQTKLNNKGVNNEFS